MRCRQKCVVGVWRSCAPGIRSVADQSKGASLYHCVCKLNVDRGSLITNVIRAVAEIFGQKLGWRWILENRPLPVVRWSQVQAHAICSMHCYRLLEHYHQALILTASLCAGVPQRANLFQRCQDQQHFIPKQKWFATDGGDPARWCSIN